MFPEPAGAWRATVSQVTAPGRYFISAGHARSRRFRYDVITVPEIRETRVRVTPPAYTHLPPYIGPVPERGIVGLPGTKVKIWAKSNRPLSGGSVAFMPAMAPQTAPTTGPSPVALSPTAEGAGEVSGLFTLSVAGTINLTVTDTAGQRSREPYTASITLLKDQRPFVRLLEPRENSFATPDARIEVQIAAEDDYGVASVQLFRGLNDTRATAADLPVPPNQPTRVPSNVAIDLSQYGLAPGDVLKFYARVEDNDPAGAKGSESPVATLRIISKEEFARMTAAREGLESLEAKYAMAARLMEQLDNAIAKLQEELKSLDPASPLAQEKLDAIRKLAEAMKDAGHDIDEAAKDELPFDVDKQFSKHLADVGKHLADAAKDAADAASQPGLSAGKAGDKLAELRKKLGAKRDEYKKEVTQPLDDLEKIFPLIEDQARYIELWQRQSDLAERMKSAADAKADDPRAKARLRDLEGEQRQLIQDLNQLLDEINTHAARLPVVKGIMVRSGGAPEPLAGAGIGAARPCPLR